jgi:hypothetical protein
VDDLNPETTGWALNSMPELEAVVMDISPPDGRPFWLTEDMLPLGRDDKPRPTFKVAEVASTFFARSPDWLRWVSGKNDFRINGELLEIQRTDSGSRRYTLVDIERLAHALFQAEKIDTRQFVGVINIVRWIAYVHGIFNETEMAPAAISRFYTDQDTGMCDQCLEDDHAECETTLKLAFLDSQGKVPDPQALDRVCSCYRSNPVRHGIIPS